MKRPANFPEISFGLTIAVSITSSGYKSGKIKVHKVVCATGLRLRASSDETRKGAGRNEENALKGGIKWPAVFPLK
ncbi:MAG: hypothetical protein AB1638_07910 [Nitrospirota bacterium]